MGYANQVDMVERFGEAELAQRTNRVDGQTIATAVLARALTDADAEIDAHLATRYSLPLALVPPVLTRLAADIARYRLFDDGVPETVRLRYQDAVSLLRRMASGEVRLGEGSGQADGAQPAAGGLAVAVRAPQAVFGASQLSNY